MSWTKIYHETKTALREFTDDEIIQLLDNTIATTRAINSELERRAQLDNKWPAEIMVRAGDVYRGYIPEPAKPEISQELLDGLDDLESLL